MMHSEKLRYRMRFAWIVGMILLTVCAAFAGISVSTDRAYAFTENNLDAANTLSIGELLLGNYDTSKSGGKVFDGVRFGKLIDAFRGDGEDKTAVADLSDKDAQAIRDANDGKDIIVEIDDKLWTVTDLRKLDDGRVIATMWLATSAETSQWNTWYADSPADTYPGNMYSTSYIRANALNSGGCGYAAAQGVTTLTPIAQSAGHQYAKFTMDKVQTDASSPSRNLSLTNYIVQPKDVAYQETETIRTYNSTFKTCPNEAWGTPDLEDYNANVNYSKKDHYTEWSSDYLWLPSLAETGHKGITGIWNLSDNQRSNEVNTWLRSGYYFAFSAYFLDPSGNGYTFYTEDTYVVRPAFHLDLTQAAADATEPVAAPTLGTSAADKTKDYTGADLTFAFQNFDSQKVNAKITAKDPSGVAMDASAFSFDATTGKVKAKHAGTYTAEFTFIQPGNCYWTDETGGSGKRTITFTIKPKQLTVSLTNTVPSNAWSWTVGDDYDATLTVSGIASGDTVKLTATYTSDKAGGAKQDIAAVQNGAQTVATIDLSAIPVGSYELTAALDKSAADNDNINYSISNGLTTANIPKKFTVTAKNVTDDDLKGLSWLYTAKDQEGNKIAGGADDSALPQGNKIGYALYKTATGSAAIVYEMSIDKSKFPKDGDGNALIAIDELNTSYTGGYIDRSGSTVGVYKTKVLLKTLSDDYLFPGSQKTYEVTLQWEIVKGTLDLSGIKWEYVKAGSSAAEYTEAIEYNDGKNITVRVKADSLPLGITLNEHPSYVNNVKKEVGTYTAKTSSWAYDTNNFDAPSTTELQLQWEITRKAIPIQWKGVAKKNDHGKTYILQQIRDDAGLYADYIEYKYYDEEGNELTLEQLNAIDVGTNVYTFTVEAYLNDAGKKNYTLQTADGSNPKVEFSVGDGKELATASFAGDGNVEYDGNAKYTTNEITLKIESGGVVGKDDYTIAYYKGNDLTDMSNNVLLDGAPTDAGDYVIVITLCNGAEDSYVLDSEAYAVHIAPKSIALPTVKEATFNGTEYGLLDLLTGYDAQIMTLDGELAATNAGTYRATVELTNSNYAWATDGDALAAEQALVWTISKVQIEERWSNASGKPIFMIPSKYAEYVQVVYEYVDADGNVVAEADLVVGQQYKMVAKLSGAGAENFEITDEEGNVLEVPTQSSSDMFTHGQTGNPDNPNNPDPPTTDPDAPTPPAGSGDSLANAKWFRIVMYAIAGCVAAMTLMMFAIWMSVASIRRMRKRKIDRTANES